MTTDSLIGKIRKAREGNDIDVCHGLDLAAQIVAEHFDDMSSEIRLDFHGAAMQIANELVESNEAHYEDAFPIVEYTIQRVVDLGYFRTTEPVLNTVTRGVSARKDEMAGAEYPPLSSQDENDCRKAFEEWASDKLLDYDSAEDAWKAAWNYNRGASARDEGRPRAYTARIAGESPAASTTSNNSVTMEAERLPKGGTRREFGSLNQQPDDYTLVPNAALRWLFGEEGSFEKPEEAKGNYWWRSRFRKMIGDPNITKRELSAQDLDSLRLAWDSLAFCWQGEYVSVEQQEQAQKAADKLNAIITRIEGERK